MDTTSGTHVVGRSRADSDPPPARPATCADLDDLPDDVDGEIIDGRLYTMLKPRPRHVKIASVIGMVVGPPYHLGSNGPGGWWILVEPGIELPEAAKIGPDVAGWRRERLPELPEDPIGVVPDWICEVLSPSTRQYDLSVKRPFYARVGVPWMWIVDPEVQLVTVSRLHEGRWSEIGTFAGDLRVQFEPFESAELDLAEWWRSK